MIHMYLTKFLKGNERTNLFSENLKHAACSILLQFFFQSKSLFLKILQCLYVEPL